MSHSLLSYKQHLNIKDGKVLDPIRKKWIVLKPEELVRQLCLQYLINDIKLSKNRISLERGLKINHLQKRYDFIVFDTKQAPLVLVECKSYSVSIDQGVLDQAARYNMQIKAPYLWITNGEENLFFEIDRVNKKTIQLDSLENIFTKEK